MTAELFGQLAVYHELAGDFDEAMVAIRNAITDADHQPELQLIYARLLGHRGQHEQSSRILKQLVRRLTEASPPRLAIQAFYQLGISRDQRGQYRRAHEAVLRAKEIQKAAPNASRLARQTTSRGFQLAEIYRQIDSAVLSRWRATPLSPLPGGIRPAHLIGFPRSGTTLLEQVLNVHPQLGIASERPIFTELILPELTQRQLDASTFETVDRATAEQLDQLRNFYIECCDDVCGGNLAECQVLLDKKPANSAFLFAMLRVLPESRLIVAIRDPRDVLVSCFMRYYPLTDLSSCYLSWGAAAMAYAQYMEIWLYMRELLPPEQFLEVRYEDTISNHASTAQRVFDFLDLPPEATAANYLDQPGSHYVHSPTFAEVRSPIHDARIGRWKNYREFLEPFLPLLEPFVKALDYPPSEC